MGSGRALGAPCERLGGRLGSRVLPPYEGDGRRNSPYDPRMMVKVLIYRMGRAPLVSEVGEAGGGYRVSDAGGDFPSTGHCEFRRSEGLPGGVRQVVFSGCRWTGRRFGRTHKRKAMSYGMVKEERDRGVVKTARQSTSTRYGERSQRLLKRREDRWRRSREAGGRAESTTRGAASRASRATRREARASTVSRISNFTDRAAGSEDELRSSTRADTGTISSAIQGLLRRGGRRDARCWRTRALSEPNLQPEPSTGMCRSHRSRLRTSPDAAGEGDGTRKWPRLLIKEVMGFRDSPDLAWPSTSSYTP